MKDVNMKVNLTKKSMELERLFIMINQLMKEDYSKEKEKVMGKKHFRMV